MGRRLLDGGEGEDRERHGRSDRHGRDGYFGDEAREYAHDLNGSTSYGRLQPEFRLIQCFSLRPRESRSGPRI